MKIKFNNGYTVEIYDCKGMSYHEVRRRAYNAMKALMKDSKKVKDMPLLSDPRESIVTGVMTSLTNLKKAIKKGDEEVIKDLFDLALEDIKADAEEHVETYKENVAKRTLASLLKTYNEINDLIQVHGTPNQKGSYKKYLNTLTTAWAEKLQDSKKVKDMPLLGDPAITVTTNTLTSLTNLKKLIEKQDKKAIASAFRLYLKDMEADVNKNIEKYKENQSPAALKKLIKEYSDVLELAKKWADEDIANRMETAINTLKEAWNISLTDSKKTKDAWGSVEEMASATTRDGKQVMASAWTTSTRAYNTQHVKFLFGNQRGEGANKYQNRTWERWSFATALRNAMIDAGIDRAFADEVEEKASSFEDAIKYFAEHYQAGVQDSRKKPFKIVKTKDSKDLPFSSQLRLTVKDAFQKYNDLNNGIDNSLETTSLTRLERVVDSYSAMAEKARKKGYTEEAEELELYAKTLKKGWFL